MLKETITLLKKEHSVLKMSLQKKIFFQYSSVFKVYLDLSFLNL